MYIFIFLLWSMAIMIVFREKGFIYETNNSVIKFLLRRVNQTSMLYIPLIFKNNIVIVSNNVNILIVIFLGVIYFMYILNNWRNFQFLIADIGFLKKENPTYIYLINLINSIFLIIGEELYFRFILSELLYDSKLLFLLVSSILFIFCHVVSNPKMYKKVDIVTQFTFSVISGILLIISGELIYSIVAHLLYNSPYLLVLIKRIWINN